MKDQIIKLELSTLKTLIKEENLLPFNREISLAHVKKMQKSVENCGILRLPVIGKLNYDNEKLVIVDGQHLIKSQVNNNVISIDVIVKVYTSKSEVIRDIAILNNTQKTWNDANYLNAWFKFGKDNLDYYSNYAYLNMIYNEMNLPCGLLVDIYCVNKMDFRDGKLRFKNREFSDKITQIANILANDYKKGSFTLQGLRLWCFDMLKKQKEIDFIKLNSRIKIAILNNEDKNCTGRDDFKDFLQRIYTRV